MERGGAGGGTMERGGAMKEDAAPSGQRGAQERGTSDQKKTQKSTEQAPSGQPSTKQSQDGKSGQPTTRQSQDEKSGTTTRQSQDGKSGTSTQQSQDGKSGTSTQQSQGTQSGGAKQGTTAQGSGSLQTKSVSLTTEQKTTIRNTVITSGPRVTNVNFDVKIGVAVPRTVRLAPVPTTIISIEPEWRGYMYFVYNEEIIIVEPRTLQIVYVLVI